MLREKLLWAQSLVLAYCAQHVTTRHKVPCHHALFLRDFLTRHSTVAPPVDEVEPLQRLLPHGRPRSKKAPPRNQRLLRSEELFDNNCGVIRVLFREEVATLH